MSLKYYNNGLECHKYEEGCQPEGYNLGLLKYADIETIDFYKDFVPYYETHSRSETALKFNITENIVKELCRKYNYKKPWGCIRYTRCKNENILPNNLETIFNSINWSEYISYYNSHTRDETCEKYNIDRTTHDKLCKLHNFEIDSREKAKESNNRRSKFKKAKHIKDLLDSIGDLDTYIEYYKKHTRDQTLSYYNISKGDHEYILELTNFVKSKTDIRLNTARKYYYDDIWFDSLPEVAVYIYCKNNNIPIEVEPIKCKYKYLDKEYNYLPDFKINNKLIEIKGDHFFKEDGTMCNPYDHSQDDKYEAKHQCGLANNVEFWRFKDYKFALDYLAQINFDLKIIKRSEH